MQSVDTKRAVIVGASSGIGAELARKLAHEGYQLMLLARREDRLKALCASINSELQIEGAQYITHDVTDYQAITALFNKIVADLGGVELFIYNSGTIQPLHVDEFSFEKDKVVMDVNIIGAMAWLNPVAEYFQQ